MHADFVARHTKIKDIVVSESGQRQKTEKWFDLENSAKEIRANVSKESGANETNSQRIQIFMQHLQLQNADDRDGKSIGRIHELAFTYSTVQ